MKTLGEYIRERREELDYSLREFAKKVDISAPFLSDIELGHRYPSDKVLRKIAKHLEVSFDKLKGFDTRVSIKDIKKYLDSDPNYGFAFRKLAESKVSPEELLNLIEKEADEEK